jgi:hypothetical protein
LEITCYKCKNTYVVPAGALLNARLKYALGYKEYKFTCPNCGAKNALTPEEFRSNDIPQAVVPVTGTPSQTGRADKEGFSLGNKLAGRAPTNPVDDPGDEMQQRDAIVQVRDVEARRDHSSWSEVMGTFSKGERITIVDTWTDGENTWVKLGPERWINIEQDGEPVLDLID